MSKLTTRNHSTRPVMLSCLLLLILLAAAPAYGSGFGFEKADCTETWANVSIPSVAYDCGSEEVDSSGPWSVGGGSASGVQLKYYVDDQLYQTEQFSGTSGTWDFADDFDANCSSHTLKVVACAKVGSAVCESHCDDDSEGFPSLPSASLDSCPGSFPQYYCTCSVSGGESPYTAEWKYGSYSYVPAYPTSPSSGPWSTSFVCKEPVLVRCRVTDDCDCSSTRTNYLCFED